ncbi:MAG: AAA family ATPase [Deltaproteobacteria bacterium]|nr:AAA family ATPase [Deltaproteobacteria bacterium]
MVLIDEYYAPTTNNITDPQKLNIAKRTHHSFYNSLKYCENTIDRFSLTGITRFPRLSVFWRTTIL